MLEVLIALAIFASSALIILEVSSRSVREQSRLTDKTFATYVAENKLETLRLQTKLPDTGIDDDTTTMAGREWHVRTETSKTGTEGIRKVVVSVRAEREQQNAIVTLNGYFGER